MATTTTTELPECVNSTWFREMTYDELAREFEDIEKQLDVYKPLFLR